MGLCVISEEMLFIKYKCHALKMTGLEGVCGGVIFIVGLIIFNLIPCDQSEHTFCDLDDKLVNTVVSFKIIFENTKVFSFLLCFMVFVTGYKLTSIYLVKCSTATNRMTVDASRTLLIWSFFLLIPKNWHEHEYFDFV